MLTLRIPRGNFHAVAYSTDGRYLVSLNSGSRIRIWSTADFSECMSFLLPGSLAYHTQLALIGNLALTNRGLYSLESAWEWIAEGKKGSPQNPVRQIEIENANHSTHYMLHPDGSQILGLTQGYYGSRGPKVTLLDTMGRVQQTITIPESYYLPAIAPDGRTLALFHNRNAILFDLTSQHVIGQLRHTDFASHGLFARDGRSLYIGAGRSVWRWDLSSVEGMRYPAFQRFVEAMALHPDGHLLTVADKMGELRMIDTTGGREINRLNFGVGAIHGLAFSPEGMTLACAAHQNALVIMDLE